MSGKQHVGPGTLPQTSVPHAQLKAASLGSLTIQGQTCARPASGVLRWLRLKRPNYKVIRTALFVAVNYLITHWTVPFSYL